MNLGDFLDGSTVNFTFTTRTTAGVPAAFDVTSPIAALKVYKNNSAVQSTAGITFTTNFDSVTGLHHVSIDTSVAVSPDFYAPGNDYMVAINNGTVNSVNVAGEVIAHFSIENRSSSLNATALAALEDQFDGTGLTGDTYPATQDQLGALTVTGAAVNQTAESYVLTTGTQSANTVTSTVALDGTRHEHTDSAGAMDLYYQFDIGADGVPTSVTMTGYLTGGNDSLGVYAYNWATTSWEQVGTLQGGNASNAANTYNLFAGHVGTGANAGKVRIRFYTAAGLTTAVLAVDQIFASYAVIPASLQTKGTVSDSTSPLTATTTSFRTDLTDVDDFWIDAMIIFTSGSLSGQSRIITDFANTNGVVTLDEALSGVPADGDDFIIHHTHVHTVSQLVNSILTTQMTEDYAANGVAPTLAQAQFAIHQMLMQFGISGTSLTVKKLDNSTTAFIVTLDDASDPTSAVRT